MSSPIDRDLKMILHPVIFVLKEGQEFKQNLLDYSLLMLHVTSETIKSPINFLPLRNPVPSEIDYINITLPPQALKNK
jgi:hypothetical protein